MSTITCHTADPLFHGTLATFPIEDLAPRSAGGILWTAASSAVAQTYIPDAQTRATFGDWRLFTRPDEPFHAASATGICPVAEALLAHLGCQTVVHRSDPHGRPVQWSTATTDGRPIATPRNRDVIATLCDELGYTPDRHHSVLLSCRTTDAGLTVMPAEWRPPGQLLCLRPLAPLRIADRTGQGHDLLDPQHLHIDQFVACDRAGFDGVRIDDYCQTRTWGNVGHHAVGLFARAFARLNVAAVPATHYEWPDDGRPFADHGPAHATALAAPTRRCHASAHGHTPRGAIDVSHL